ncbi:PREDICTED: uncharacterized protein LOC106104504 [Papilio polytes]|uniref:uncharacterized protein LOC106104504 n=1 Tax=Papilio polytes TaxID=76194 RepID=UPI000675E7F5|nr:PREDICTED: uncharacterized protein LOC106104504 [Papilio polytes]
MFKVCGIIMIVFGIMTVFSLANKYEYAQTATIKLGDVKPGRDRESLERYLYQGYWKNKSVWLPKWIKTWQMKSVFVPVWKRVWYRVKTQEWVNEHAAPPTWLKNVRGGLSIKLPQ